MGKLIRKNLKNCIMSMQEINGRVTMKFKKNGECESAQDILNSVKNSRIIVKWNGSKIKNTQMNTWEDTWRRTVEMRDKCQRLGGYQRAVMKGIKRDGSLPYSIRKGYSRQVESLIRRNLIKKRNSRLYLTNEGENRIKGKC